MTATTTPGLRISPELWAEFGLLCAKQGTKRNTRLVDMIRAAVVAERIREGGK